MVCRFHLSILELLRILNPPEVFLKSVFSRLLELLTFYALFRVKAPVPWNEKLNPTGEFKAPEKETEETTIWPDHQSPELLPIGYNFI